MNDDRLVNPRGLRRYRKRYSVVEARWGALVLVCLVAVGGGIAWMGAHPPPNQFGDKPRQPATSCVACAARQTPPEHRPPSTG